MRKNCERLGYGLKCPVCDNVNTSLVCLRCGFDGSTNYEKYPTFGAVGKVPSVSALRQDWAQKHPEPVPSPPVPAPEPPRKKPWLAIAACAVTLVLGIGIGAGLGGGKPEPAEPAETVQMQKSWETNILRSDEPVDTDGSRGYTIEEMLQTPVFGSDYRRDQISSVTFLDTLAEQPDDAWDVSEAGNGTVMAWVKPNGARYDLYIGAEDGVWAGKSCMGMFGGYENADHITFGNAFHTENVQNMSWMFFYCDSLTDLNLGDHFDTSNVQNMSWMFDNCASLTDLNLGDHFDTSIVQDMSCMFSCCWDLTELNLGDRFDTSNVQNMAFMFSFCSSLTELNLGDSFVTTNADTKDMFAGCPAGADYQHLLH